MSHLGHKCFALACILTSLAWPAACTDEVSNASPESAPSPSRMHDEMEGSHGSHNGNSTNPPTAPSGAAPAPAPTAPSGARPVPAPAPKEKTWEDMDCTEICSKRWSDDGEKEHWHKSGGRTHEHGRGDEEHGRASEDKRHQRNGSFKAETFKGTWKRGENGTWNRSFEREVMEGKWHRRNGTLNGSFEREVVEGKWHSRNGTWNGTFERDSVKGEWERSRNGTLNRSSERQSGKGEWQRSANGSRSSHYKEADRKHHEDDGMHHSGKDRVRNGTHAGKPRCDCRNRSGANELDAVRREEMDRHRGGSHSTRGDSDSENAMVRGGNNHDNGSDGFGSAALEEQPQPQTEVMGSSNNDQNSEGNGFSNAAVLGLAGAGVAALCVAITVLSVCYRRNGKAPLTSGVISGKSIDNTASSDHGVVAGVVVTTV